MGKNKFYAGNLVRVKSTEMVAIIISFAYYWPIARAHACGTRGKYWNVLCSDGTYVTISEDNLTYECKLSHNMV